MLKVEYNYMLSMVCKWDSKHILYNKTISTANEEERKERVMKVTNTTAKEALEATTIVTL